MDWIKQRFTRCVVVAAFSTLAACGANGGNGATNACERDVANCETVCGDYWIETPADTSPTGHGANECVCTDATGAATCDYATNPYSTEGAK